MSPCGNEREDDRRQELGAGYLYPDSKHNETIASGAILVRRGSFCSTYNRRVPQSARSGTKEAHCRQLALS